MAQRAGASILAISVGLAACGSSPATDASSPSALETGTPDAPSTRCARSPTCLERSLSELCAEDLVLGAVLALEHEDGTRTVATCGHADLARTRPMQRGDRARVGSITKTFTATLALLGIARGELHLDDTVASHGVTTDAAELITVQQLLRHTAGLPEYNDDPAFDWSRPWTIDEVLAWVTAEREPSHAPGAAFGYSGTHYQAMAAVLARAGGNDYGSLLHARLLDPLGLEDTFLEGAEEVSGGRVEGSHPIGVELGPREHADDWASADGSLVSSVDDLLTFFERTFVTRDVLPAAQLDAMLTVTSLPGGEIPSFLGNPYGMGVQLEDATAGTIVLHGGRDFGFVAYVGVQPDTGRGVAVLVNSDHADPRRYADLGWALLAAP